jgi:4-carboxymuconolactone decarboxylase
LVAERWFFPAALLLADDEPLARLTSRLCVGVNVAGATTTKCTGLPMGTSVSTVRDLHWRTCAMADIPNRPEYQSDLFKKGLEVRRDVLGASYVDGSLTRADDFNAAFQQITTEVAWGMIWTRPGLTRKTRSVINLTMLAALNRGSEFRLHLRAALTNGVTRDEIKEILLQIGAYCGIPACLEAFRIATEVFKEVDGAKGGD